MEVSLCRSGCCPRLVFSDDGNTAVLDGHRSKGEVIEMGDSVGIRLTMDNIKEIMRVLVDRGVGISSVEEKVTG